VYSEKATARLLDNMGTAVLVFDADMQLRYLNQAGEVMFAHSARHACGRSVRELVRNSDVLADQLLATIASEEMMSHRGCLLELPDAPDLRVNCIFTFITDDNGQPCVLVELRQIDYHLRIEQEEHLITQQQATHVVNRPVLHPHYHSRMVSPDCELPFSAPSCSSMYLRPGRLVMVTLRCC